MRAFNELVAEKGHTGLTVREIAGCATINRANFYAHFADKMSSSITSLVSSIPSVEVPRGAFMGVSALDIRRPGASGPWRPPQSRSTEPELSPTA